MTIVRHFKIKSKLNNFIRTHLNNKIIYLYINDIWINSDNIVVISVKYFNKNIWEKYNKLFHLSQAEQFNGSKIKSSNFIYKLKFNYYTFFCSVSICKYTAL